VPLDVENIEFRSTTYSKQEMRRFHFDADCMVFPTRGEGFGLPALEAMATGLPTIVTGWGGPVDYSDPDDTLMLDHGMSEAVDMDLIYREYFATGEDAGQWAEPSLEDLRAKMRWCYENRGPALLMGKRAAARIAREWTWEQKMRELVDLLERNIHA
jgi:glycosyltransferase involved in cell wall biosynthesis